MLTYADGRYHQHLSPIAEADADTAALLAYPNGPLHDCHFIARKLRPLTRPVAAPPATPATATTPATPADAGGACGGEAAGVLYADEVC